MICNSGVIIIVNVFKLYSRIPDLKFWKKKWKISHFVLLPKSCSIRNSKSCKNLYEDPTLKNMTKRFSHPVFTSFRPSHVVQVQSERSRVKGTDHGTGWPWVIKVDAPLALTGTTIPMVPYDRKSNRGNKKINWPPNSEVEDLPLSRLRLLLLRPSEVVNMISG